MSKLLLLLNENAAIDHQLATGLLPPGTVLTRASAGTRASPSGLLETVGVNAPRSMYDPATHACIGLLIEEQRTNLAPQSSALEAWSIIVASVDANSTVAPDGTAAAETLVSTGGGNARIQKTVGATAGVQYTASAFVKTGTAPRFGFAYHGGSGGVSSPMIKYNLSDSGSVHSTQAGATGSITLLPNGFYYVTMTFTANMTGGLLLAAPDNATDNTYYLPKVDSAGISVIVWGVQMEQAATASSYIPSAGAPTTRAADFLTFAIPKGISTLRFVFDNNSTQDVNVSEGMYSVPTTLNRPCLARILGL
jgi:hypothetical protein